MKNLQEILKENLVAEAIEYKPLFKLTEWTKALKELSKGAKSNMSQLSEMEKLNEHYYETSDEWVDELYENGFDPKNELREIIEDIAEFHFRYYNLTEYDYYRGFTEVIDSCKDNMSKGDYGIECENIYTFLEYIGPKGLEKYAELIAKYGDCSNY